MAKRKKNANRRQTDRIIQPKNKIQELLKTWALNIIKNPFSILNILVTAFKWYNGNQC